MMSKQTEALIKLQNYTKSKCKQDGFKCCDEIFCAFAEKQAMYLGHTPHKIRESGLMFLGKHGCTIPPQFRPGCASFVCPHHMKNGKFAKKLDKLRCKIFKEGPYREAMDLTKTLAREALLRAVSDINQERI